MKRVLVLFAHPKFEQSRTNMALVQRIKQMEGVTFHDLYERYPDFNIDVVAEKNLLEQHDILVWHYPFYWYSCPPLMKQWMDVVLEFGWAYGPEGNALKDKTCLNVITAGGSRELYCSKGNNHYSVNDFLRPFEQTARICGMEYLPPFMVMGTHQISPGEIGRHADQYKQLIRLLQSDLWFESSDEYEFLNDTPQLNKGINDER